MIISTYIHAFQRPESGESVTRLSFGLTANKRMAKASRHVTDKDCALAMLARLNTPAARSAALRSVANQELAKGALSQKDVCSAPD